MCLISNVFHSSISASFFLSLDMYWEGTVRSTRKGHFGGERAGEEGKKRTGGKDGLGALGHALSCAVCQLWTSDSLLLSHLSVRLFATP